MHKTIQLILDHGLHTGFSTVEAFAEKTEGCEYQWFPREQSAVLSSQGQRVSVRSFWEQGEPVGFNLTKPDGKTIRAAFDSVYAAHMPQQKKNYRLTLPASVVKRNVAIYDDNADNVDLNAFNSFLDRIDETMVSHPFQHLQLKKIRLNKNIKRVYIGNTNGLNAKYIKSRFDLTLSVMLNGIRIDVNQSRVFFSQLDPLRLITRALNLLQSLTEKESRIPVPKGKSIYLILSPESSAAILREFSSYFMKRADPELMKIQYPSILNILDDPLMDGQAGSVPFDDEGVQDRGVEPSKKTQRFLVEKGVFGGVVTDLAEAAQNRSVSTGNGFRSQNRPFPSVRFSNLFIKPTVLPVKNLWADAGEGIVVSLVKLKAMDRRGYLFSAYGYRFKDHRMMEPVHFYFRTTFRSWFLSILKVSSEIKFFHSAYTIGSPYLLVKAAGKPDNIFEI